MMELVFVACLAAEPLNCETKAMQFADMSAMACMMCAQQVLAQWGNEHPGWKIQRWTCQPETLERSASEGRWPNAAPNQPVYATKGNDLWAKEGETILR